MTLYILILKLILCSFFALLFCSVYKDHIYVLTFCFLLFYIVPKGMLKTKERGKSAAI